MIYVGTFSRTVFSSLRIGYLIVPNSLLSAFTTAKWLCDRHTATLEQDTLAEFITTGMYERHLRRLRRRNAASRQVLLAALGVGRYFLEQTSRPGLMLGYPCMREADIREGIRRLAEIL